MMDTNTPPSIKVINIQGENNNSNSSDNSNNNNNNNNNSNNNSNGINSESEGKSSNENGVVSDFQLNNRSESPTLSSSSSTSSLMNELQPQSTNLLLSVNSLSSSPAILTPPPQTPPPQIITTTTSNNSNNVSNITPSLELSHNNSSSTTSSAPPSPNPTSTLPPPSALSDGSTSPKFLSTPSPSSTSSLDYSRFLRDIESIAIRSDNAPLRALQTLIEHLSNINLESLSDETSNQLLIWIPRYIYAVFSLKIFTPELKQNVIIFFHTCIHTIINCIQLDLPDLWVGFARIFNPSHTFYSSIKFEIDPTTAITKESIYFKKQDPITSSFYYQNLMILEKFNFFQIFMDSLIGKHLTLIKIKSILKTLIYLKEYLNPAFHSQYVPKLKDIILANLLEISFDDQSGTDKEAFKDICTSIQNLLSPLLPFPEIARIFQEFDLNRSLRYFQSSNLEKKLRGLRFIKKSAKCVNIEQMKAAGFAFGGLLKKQKPKSKQESSTSGAVTGVSGSNTSAIGGGSGSSSSGNNSSNSGVGQQNGNGNSNNNNNNGPVMDQQLLLNWILKHEIVETFCKISDQPDIIRHGLPVMIFLSNFGKLGDHQLELLWDSSIGKHESVRSTIYNALLELFIHLHLEQLDHFYEFFNKSIVNMKPMEFDNDLLQFIFNFSTIAIQHQENTNPSKKSYGIELFWKLLQDKDTSSTPQNDSVNQILINRSKSFLVSLLRLQECAPLRMTYIEFAIENLKNFQSVFQSLLLILNIVELFVKKQRATLESLESKFKLFDLFFKEIANFKKVTHQRSATLSFSSLEGLNHSVIYGSFPHIQQVQTRFEFLEYILSQSSIMLNIQQLDIIWEAFVTGAITADEKEACFTWLKNTKIQGKERIAFPEPVVRYLFQDKMANLDTSVMGLNSYSVYERYFFYINERAGKIKKIAGSIFTGDLFSNQLGLPNKSKVNAQQQPPVSPSLSPSTSPSIQSANGSTGGDCTPSDYYIVSLDLFGISQLWSAALGSMNLDVSDQAINTLNALYQGGDKSSSKFKDEYLRVCMDQIVKALNTKNNNQSSVSHSSINRICRALFMIKTFASSESNSSGVGGKDQLSKLTQNNSSLIPERQYPYLIKLDRGDSYIINDVTGTDTLRMLKRKIASIYGTPRPPVRSLRVFLGDKELKDDDRSMEEFKIFDSSGAQQYPLLIKRTIVQNNTNNNTTNSNNSYINGSTSTTSTTTNTNTNNSNSNNNNSAQKEDKKEKKKKDKNDKSRSDSSSSQKDSETSEEIEDDYIDLLDDTPVVSMVMESIQHQLGGFGLIGDVQLRKVQETKSRVSTGRGKVENSLAILISKPQYFDQIFNLLDFDNEIAENAWSVVSELPMNSKVINDIKNFKETLIPSNSIYKSIYYLKALDSILDGSFESSNVTNGVKSAPPLSLNDPNGVEEMKYRFINKGAVIYLTQMLRDLNIVADRGHLKLYNLLLKNLFTLSIINTAEISSLPTFIFRKEAVPMFESPPFILKLFNLLSTAPEFQGLLNNESTTNDFNSLYHYGMEILQLILKNNPKEQFEMVQGNSSPEWSNWLKSLLLECRHHSVQLKASRLVQTLATLDQTQEIRIERSLFFLSNLLSFLPDINRYHQTAEQFFCLLSELVNIGYPTSSPSPSPKQSHEKVVLDDQGKLQVASDTGSDHPNDNIESQDFVKTLLSNLIKELTVMPIREITSNQPKDHILVGILNVIRNLVRRRPQLKTLCKEKDLLLFLFKKGLFKTPTANDHGSELPPLCKTRESRLACYRLLKEFAKNDYNNFFLIERLINDEMDRIDPTSDWNYSPIDREKSIYNYVGLKNQGTTCYMNSLLQQLFHSTSLKNSLLNLSVPNISDLVKSSCEYQQNNQSPPTQSQQQQQQIQQPTPDQIQQTNLLNHVQLLFIYLQESSKRYYDSINFCKSITNYDGTPINLGVQMDAYEFFHLFLDKMEVALKNISPEQKGILNEAFGGVLTNQFIPRDCTHRSHCEEPFFSISLEVKNKKSVLESLDLFIQEESLKDYKCDSCNSKVEITKRCLIDKLPNTLILHLKRFEFDLENMRNIKLNDYCEFPHQIDMAPYTIESIESKSSNGITKKSSIVSHLYELNGIVLHQGTADSGHYITLVKDGNGHWFELNDTLVLPYDFRRMEQDCFGGFDDVKEFDKVQQKQVMVRKPKTGNAYMLFYTRSENSNNHHSHCKPIPPAIKDAKIPKEVLETVWNENRSFLLEKYLFDNDFSTFIWDIVNLYHDPTFDPVVPTKSNITHSSSTQLALQSSIKLTTRYIIDIYSHSKERNLLDVWAYHLKRLMRESVQGTDWFIRYLVDKNLMRGLLLSCIFEKTRQTFVDLITFAILLKKNQSNENTNELSKTMVDFYNTLIGLSKSIRDYPKRTIQQLFTLLMNITTTGDIEREFVLQRGIITKLIENYIGTYMPNTIGSSGIINNSSSYVPSSYSQSSSITSTIGGNVGQNTSTSSYQSSIYENSKMIEYLCYLIRCCQPLTIATILPSQVNNYPTEQDRTRPQVHVFTDSEAPISSSIYRVKPKIHPGYCMVLSETTLVAILSKSFLLKLIKENGWCEGVRLLIMHLSWNNKSITTHFFNIIKEILLKSSPNIYHFVYPSLTCLLEIKDQHTEWRIDTIMQSLLKVPDSMMYSQEGHDNFVRYLSSLTVANSRHIVATAEEFNAWKVKHKDSIAKLIKEGYYR